MRTVAIVAVRHNPDSYVAPNSKEGNTDVEVDNNIRNSW